MTKRPMWEPPRLPYNQGVNRFYAQDTGVDVHMPVGSPVIAVADGMVIYCEGYAGKGRAHTPWVPTEKYPKDTPGCILLRFDEPFYKGGELWRFGWYAHLSDGFAVIRDGIDAPRRVLRGMMIGHSGTARGIHHIHYGMLKDRRQRKGDYMEPIALARWMETWARK